MNAAILRLLPSCPGIEIEPGIYSGCSGGSDCPTCGGVWATMMTCGTCARGEPDDWYDNIHCLATKCVGGGHNYPKDHSCAYWESKP